MTYHSVDYITLKTVGTSGLYVTAEMDRKVCTLFKTPQTAATL